MSFEKMNLCESTQVAMSVFHMFRNNTVNLVTDYSDEKVTWCRYEKEECPLEEGEVPSYQNEKLDYIARLLQHDCDQVRVHNVVRSNAELGAVFSERKLVQFYVQERGSRVKTIVNIEVCRQYVDGDEISGITAWTVDSVEILVAIATDRFSTKGKGRTDIIKMNKISRPQNVDVSPLMEQNVQGLLYFC